MTHRSTLRSIRCSYQTLHSAATKFAKRPELTVKPPPSPLLGEGKIRPPGRGVLSSPNNVSTRTIQQSPSGKKITVVRDKIRVYHTINRRAGDTFCRG